MPYYDQQGGQQQGDARDRITQALLAIQSPPPVTPIPPPPPPMQAPMPGAGGMTQATTGTPGVSPPLGNSMIANMTTPQLPGGGGAMTSTLAQQQQAPQLQTQPASMPSAPQPQRY